VLDKLRRALSAPSVSPGSGNTQVALRLLAAVYRNSATLPSFRDAGFRIYSQNDEDGILHMIFSVIGATGIAVEIGCGNGQENNTTNLVINSGWHALMIDADEANVESARRFFRGHRDTHVFPPEVRHLTVTSENANEAVQGFEGDVDLLSLDIDSIDYWVMAALTSIRVRVIVVETPTIWGPEYARTVPNNPAWTHAANPDFYGGSLAAFNKLLSSRGYRFLGTSKYGTNSFFLERGIGEDRFPTAPLTDGFRHPRAIHGITNRSDRSRHLPWVDV
jgi:hypothetical protein